MVSGGYSREQLLGDNLGGMTHDWIASTGTFNKYASWIENFEWVAIAPPADVNGVVKEIFQRDTLRPAGWAISRDNQHPIETIKFFDWWFSEEGQRVYNYGMEGVDYTMADGAPRYTEEVLTVDGGVSMYMREEERIFKDKGTAVQLLMFEREQRWLMGMSHIDATWDEYIAELKAMGYDEWQQMQQGAYDRYQAVLRTIK